MPVIVVDQPPPQPVIGHPTSNCPVYGAGIICAFLTVAAGVSCVLWLVDR